LINQLAKEPAKGPPLPSGVYPPPLLKAAQVVEDQAKATPVAGNHCRQSRELSTLSHPAVDRAGRFWYLKIQEEKMCLAVPGKVVSLEGDGTGKVDYLGTTVLANLSLLPEVKVGDWVIVHAGFAISRLDRTEARRTLKLFKELEKLNLSD